MNAANPEANPSIRFVAQADAGCVLTLARQRATLHAGRAGVCFEADQALRAGHEARLFGRCTGAGGEPLGRATLQVAPLPDGDDRGLCVTLRDAEGRVLLGPAVLQREALCNTRTEKPAWPRPSLTEAPAAWPAATR
jgi:hypothetical protein